jgi:hypothetical protein
MSVLFCIFAILFLGLIAIALFVRGRQRRLQVRVQDAPKIDLTGREFRTYLRSMTKEHNDVDVIGQLGFDPADCRTLEQFAPLKRGTACVFARSAALWGAPEWSEQLSLEQNAMRIRPALTLFMRLAKGRALDGFVIELRGEQYARDLQSFSRAVFFMLRALCDCEPSHCGCMRKSAARIGDYGWWFDCDKEFCFVTTFAPFYDTNHSRHAYGAGGERSAWIVLQPEFSFARRNIACGHEPTDWVNPRSERDRVRVSFLERGQNFVKRDNDAPGVEFNRRHSRAPHDHGADNVHGPTAWQIVKDTQNNGIQSCVPWWEQNGIRFDEEQESKMND